MKRFLSVLGAIFAILIFIFILSSIVGVISLMGTSEQRLSKPSILHLELEGIIMDGKDTLEAIRRYAHDDNVKGVIVQINSPGGVVGASQEIYAELKRVSQELKKPVVASCTSMAASGGYYVALGADHIVTNPGTIMGSVGVIMEFANLEKLYNWAKVERYSIKAGAYKDAGSDYRPMTDSERRLFQAMIEEVLDQFKSAIISSRELSRDLVDKYADGRIFVGEAAVKLGFADRVGTFEDARRLVGELSGLGDRPELFKPRKRRASLFLELLEARLPGASVEFYADKLLNLHLKAQPLYIMPGALGL